MKEMVGGCCVCSDERGWAENPLVYCDGHGCNVAVHQACYGIVQVPTGPWFCRKCESQERAARVRCDLCPHKEGALKRTDNGGWAHVVCALYIPEVQFANVLTMEPIVLQYVPHDRFNKTCYICEEQGRESRAASGACMTCNRHGCRQAFHVTCAQMAGLLCEEEAQEVDNVKYIGYCKYHFNKMARDPQKVSRLPCPIIPGRCSRSASPSVEKPLFYKERQKKSHKDRERVRHRKHRDSPGHIPVPPLLPISVEKHESSADSSEVTRSELKGKKPYGHRSRKTGSGKNASGASGASSTGIYTSNKDPISVRTACSTPLPSSIMSHQTSLPPYSRACSITPSSTASTTQVFSLPGSTFSIPSSHIFGSPLSMPTLLSQAESNRTEPEIEDCSFVCSGNSPRESLSSMSPISSLPPLFDSSGPSSSDNVPQITANLEQLLEKHGEAGINIVDMLQALHSLQKENRSLQDQILTLTARKEKLQLLNVQLACPFPPSLPPTSISNLSSQDSFSNKSPTSKSSFRTENSPSEDPHSGCPSRSSSCLSLHSTPPPCPLSQTAPSLPAVGAEQLMNGLIRAAGPGGPSTLATLPLLGALSGNPGVLSLNSILGTINGNLQSTLGQAQNPLCSGTASSHIPASLSSLSTLSEQQMQLAQQLQQITTAHLTVDQQNVLYQIVQHLQQRRDLQRLITPAAPPLLPVTTCSTMASSPAPPILTAQAPPFLGSQGEVRVSKIVVSLMKNYLLGDLKAFLTIIFST
ncbi:protein AF-17 isoform X3 [Rana temporaria]|uniref:protein AF-17 isoform X3 n=1 Tax=Rana temporaria TaxID=8407 RepID=UPI001AACC2F4|nr:protein AF-17 isoform X3 [Rana temporaria]